ncbi:CDP-diacylglycerol diphosphatase [Rahnella sp. PCH160]|uniref:CDP-diacylglycerol diphosphatase n=1 Tax=Rahnella sp. PCH160 TaxID=3447928 RepID=UPI0039FBCFFF
MRLRRLVLPALLLLIIIAAALWYFWPHSSNPNALWNIISQKCVPAGKPDPCAQVDEQQGFVVLKDMNGPLQYLLMPSARITGMESPALLEPETPNFFNQAWNARHFMADKYGKPIDDSNISLAVNSQYGRSQNQLHIHISCLLPQVKTTLARDGAQMGYNWQELPDKLLGHTYLARKVTPAELHEKGAFRILAQGVPDADKKMGHFGMAMVSLQSGDFLLLASERNLLKLNNASTEEIQDHNCAVLDPVPVP